MMEQMAVEIRPSQCAGKKTVSEYPIGCETIASALASATGGSSPRCSKSWRNAPKNGKNTRIPHTQLNTAAHSPQKYQSTHKSNVERHSAY